MRAAIELVLPQAVVRLAIDCVLSNARPVRDKMMMMRPWPRDARALLCFQGNNYTPNIKRRATGTQESYHWKVVAHGWIRHCSCSSTHTVCLPQVFRSCPPVRHTRSPQTCWSVLPIVPTRPLSSGTISRSMEPSPCPFHLVTGSVTVDGCRQDPIPIPSPFAQNPILDSQQASTWRVHLPTPPSRPICSGQRTKTA